MIRSILYLTVVDSELGTCEKSGRDFFKSNSDASEAKVLNPKACGIQGRPHDDQKYNYILKMSEFV